MFLLLLFLTSISAASAVIQSHFTRLSTEEVNHLLSTCGKKTEEVPDFLSVVQIWNSESQRRCGGVAISPYHVLTLPICIRNHAATEFASLDDLYIITTDRFADIPCIHDPNHSKCLMDDKFRRLTNRVVHYVVPVFTNTTFTHDFRLALLEVEDKYYMNVLVPACLPTPNKLIAREQSLWSYSYDHESLVPVKYQTVFTSKKKFCVNETTCEWFLTTSSKIGSLGDALTSEVVGAASEEQVAVVALKITNNETVDLHPWLHFICLHTGACEDDFIFHDDEIPVFDYYLDGVIVKHDASPPFWYCNEEKRRVLAETVSPLTRIDRHTAATLRRTCGIPNRMDLEADKYSFIVGIVIVSDDGTYSFCTGALISYMHVITSATCMRKTTAETKMFALFQKIGKEIDDFPTQLDDFDKFDSSDVGKRFLPITKFVATICLHEHCERANVAIAQLESRIPFNSFIQPACIPEEPSTAERDAQLIVQKYQSSGEIFSRQLDVTTVSTSLYNCTRSELRCWLVQFAGAKRSSSFEVGAPLVVFEENRLNLIGVTTHATITSTTSVNLATRIDYLATFICIHTGVCRRKEDFKGDSFSPYADKNFIVETFAIDRVRRQRKDNEHEIYSNWDAMFTETFKIAAATDVFKIQKLSEQENNEVQAMCGKKRPTHRIIDGADVILEEHPWAVMPAFHLRFMGEKRDGFMVIGTGSFISTRHVITAAHIFDYMNLYGKPIFNVIYGTNCAGKAECIPSSEQRVASVRRVIKSRSVMDIAIMELYDDIEPDATHSILCMPRQSESYKDDTPMRMYGAGYITPDMTVGSPGYLKMREFPWKSLNVTYYPRYNATLEYYIIYLEPTRIFAMPGDSGGPMVRERTEDGRSVLWAVHSGTLRLKPEFREKEELARSYAVNTDQIRSFVCKLTGVCTNGYDKYDESAIPVTISDNIPLC